MDRQKNFTKAHQLTMGGSSPKASGVYGEKAGPTGPHPMKGESHKGNTALVRIAGEKPGKGGH